MGFANPRINDISTFSQHYNSNILLTIDRWAMNGFWVKETALPDLSVGIETIGKEPYDIQMPNGQLEFGEFSATLFVDEHLQVYKELYNWIIETKAGNEITEFKYVGNLFIMNNNRAEVVADFAFKGLFLTGISGLAYTNHGADHQTITASFKYDNFTPTFKY